MNVERLYIWPRQSNMARRRCMSEGDLQADALTLKRHVQANFLARDMGRAAGGKETAKERGVPD